MVSELAFHLAERGWDVGVITSQQLYDVPDARLPRRETVRGVQITRAGSTSFGRHSLIGRAFDYLSFAFNAWAKMFMKRGTLLASRARLVSAPRAPECRDRRGDGAARTACRGAAELGRGGQAAGSRQQAPGRQLRRWVFGKSRAGARRRDDDRRDAAAAR